MKSKDKKEVVSQAKYQSLDQAYNNSDKDTTFDSHSLNLSEYEKVLVKINLICKTGMIVLFLATAMLGYDKHDYERNMTYEFLDIHPNQYDTTPHPTRMFIIQKLLHFVKWDGLMFLKIVFKGYDNVKQYAFFPGFPYLLKFLLHFMEFFTGKLVYENRLIFVIVLGLAINIACNFLNNILIFR